MMRSGFEFKSCPTHCCPVHGCKYGYADCPVRTKAVRPENPNNNGCEACERDKSVWSGATIRTRLLALAGTWEDSAQRADKPNLHTEEQIGYENGRDDQKEFCAEELRDLIKEFFG